MRKFLLTFFIVATLLLTLLPVKSYAVSPMGTPEQINAYNGYSSWFKVPPPDGATFNQYISQHPEFNATSVNPKEYDKAVADAQKNANDKACGILSMGNCIEQAIYSAAQIIGNFILSLVSWILWLGGVLFNYSVVMLVIHMRDLINKVTVIFTMWQILRDFVNMFFIFIMLYIAIQTILGLGDWKIMLRNVVLVALFLNFSFFFTGVLIDFSNTLALQFYNGFANCESDTSTGAAAAINSADGCMSATIVGNLGLGTLYAKQTSATGLTTSTAPDVAKKDGTNPITDPPSLYRFLIAVVAGSILMVITAGVFIASAILIIYRFCELIMLLMLSPLAFASLALPSAKSKVWNKWWDRLTKQLIFAPVYFMFLWIVMSVIASGTLKDNIVPSGASFQTGFNGDPKMMFGLIANYAIVIFLLGYSLKLASEIGAGGTEYAGKASKGFQNFVRNKTVGLAGKGTGKLAQHTVGRVAANLDKKWGEKTGTFGGTGIIGSQLRDLTTKKVMGTGFGAKGSITSYDEWNKTREKSNKEQVRKNSNNAVLTAGLAALDSGPHAPGSPEELARLEAIRNLQTFAQNAYPKDLQDLKADKIITMANHGLLPADKLRALLADANTSHTSPEKDNFRTAYGSNLNNSLTNYNSAVTAHTAAIGTPGEAAAKTARDNAETTMNNELGAIGERGIDLLDPTLTNGNGANSQTLIQMASQKQHDKILENTLASERQEIKNLRLAPITGPSAFGPTGVLNPTTPAKIKAAQHFARLSGAEIAKLPEPIFSKLFTDADTSVTVVESLSPQKINEMSSMIKPANATVIIDNIHRLATLVPPNKKAERLEKWLAGPGNGVL